MSVIVNNLANFRGKLVVVSPFADLILTAAIAVQSHQIKRLSIALNKLITQPLFFVQYKEAAILPLLQACQKLQRQWMASACHCFPL